MLKLTLISIILFSFAAFAVEITDFRKGKGGVLWQGEKSGGKFSYAKALNVKGKVAKLEWNKNITNQVLAIDWWLPQLKITKNKLQGRMNIKLFAGPGADEIKMVTVKFMDANGEVFQWLKDVDFSEASGWQKLSYWINPDTFFNSYGKNKDGEINLPVRFYGVAFTFKSPLVTPGYIFLDNVDFEQY